MVKAALGLHFFSISIMDTGLLDPKYLSFQIINYVLSVLMWTLLGRTLLSLLIGGHKDNWIYVMFCRLTDWYLMLVSRITFGIIGGAFLPVWGLVVLIVLRVLVFVIFYNLGLAPKMGG